MFQNVSSFICNSPQSVYSNLAQNTQITLQMLLICRNFWFPSLLCLPPQYLSGRTKLGFNWRAHPALYGFPRPVRNLEYGAAATDRQWSAS